MMSNPAAASAPVTRTPAQVPKGTIKTQDRILFDPFWTFLGDGECTRERRIATTGACIDNDIEVGVRSVDAQGSAANQCHPDAQTHPRVGLLPGKVLAKRLSRSSSVRLCAIHRTRSWTPSQKAPRVEGNAPPRSSA